MGMWSMENLVVLGPWCLVLGPCAGAACGGLEPKSTHQGLRTKDQELLI
jgi:hypothetical protein